MRELFMLFLCEAVLSGCASNTILSDSIIFSDRFNQDITQPHFATMGNISGNVAGGATAYGNEQFPADSLIDFNYQDFNPGFGYAIGLLSRRIALGVSLQPIRVGADISVAPWEQMCLSASATSSRSFAASLLIRYNLSIAVGPFYRRDRYQGLNLAQFLEYVPPSERERHYYAESIGINCHIRDDDFNGSERIYVMGFGYTPKMKSVFLSVGINRISIY